MADLTALSSDGSTPAGDPRKFGRVDEQGRVFVREGDTEREVGSYPDGVPEDPLALYVRRFTDLDSSITLFEARLTQISPREIDSTMASLAEQLKAPAVVGDIAALRARYAKLEEAVANRKVEVRKEREEAKAKALTDRTAVVERAEELAAMDPQRVPWKKTGQEFRDLFDRWKSLQRQGPRLEKAVEDALWKRFTTARNSYDKSRRAFFAAQNELQTKAKAIKEKLIVEAEKLQDSTDWHETAGEFKRLMDQWRAAGRASRKDDDALWAKFRASQQTFFNRLRQHDQEQDEARQANLQAKLEVVQELQQLLPVEDVAAAKAKYRELMDKFAEIGPVPYADRQRVEDQVSNVEVAIKEAEDEQWRRSNPETQARARGMASQLEEQIAKLTADLESAQAKGDDKKASQISEALETKRAWLEQVTKSVE